MLIALSPCCGALQDTESQTDETGHDPEWECSWKKENNQCTIETEEKKQSVMLH